VDSFALVKAPQFRPLPEWGETPAPHAIYRRRAMRRRQHGNGAKYDGRRDNGKGFVAPHPAT
jgi:hypothetical protein